MIIQLLCRVTRGGRVAIATNRLLPLSLKRPHQQQHRQLHAQWTYLLDHSWVYKDKSNGKSVDPLMIGRGVNGLIESDTSSDDSSTRTVLFLHDAYADKTMGMGLAKSVVNQMWHVHSQSGGKVPLVQALMVNIRGSGESSSDDYDNPHTLRNAAEDVLTVVQTACAGRTLAPSVVVAYGTLGRALAHVYAQVTLNEGGVTRNVHSEVSGEGAIAPPKLVLLLPREESVDKTKDSVRSGKYTFEEDVSAELLASAKEFLNNLKLRADEERDEVPTNIRGIENEAQAFELIKNSV